MLTLGVSELQLAARRLGDHQITMSTGTNQEKRGAKEAYAKVKVEVATLEAEVEELKDVLQVLKASKADKEALEDGDINSILFASAGSGGGGSGGGVGLSKSSSSGVDSGGNCEVTFKSKARLKSVPKLDVETSTSVWEVINFISNFEIKMRSHKVSKGDQKIYLLEALKLGVVRDSLMDELFEEVRRKVLGYNYLNLILDDWQRVFQKEEERVVDFKVWVCTYLHVLGIDMVQKLEDQKRIIAELRKKFRKTLVEVFEGGGRNILDISWVTLWKELETLESSFFYLQHLKLLKIQAVSQPSSRGDGGGKGKNRGSAAERGKGQGRGRGGGDSGQTIHCFRCGQGGHMANACNHLKVKDIPKNADGTWPRICHHCFKAGHLRSKCPDLGKKPAAAGGSYYVEVCSQDLGWVGAANLPEEDLPGEEGVSQEEILNFWRGDGGGDSKQESGDFCGWVGEIPTPIILLKDRLIGDKGGEELLEEGKEGISFSSPEIPRGGNEEGENFVGMVEGKREISSSPSEGENFVGAVEGKREISSSPPGGESSDRGGDFSKEEFSPTTERGGSEGGGSFFSGWEGSPHSEAALRRVRVAEAEALRRAKGQTPQAPLIPYFLTAGGQEIVGLLDTGSSHFLVKKEIFEKMEGKEVVTPTSYKGVEGGFVQQQEGKLVKCQTCFGETDYIAYPQLAQLAVEALVPLQIGLAMGLEVKRVPKYWISKLQKSNDRKWVQSVRERLKETKFLKAQREFVLNGIERALRENSKLSLNTRCNLPNSSFRIELKKGVVASNHHQYLILEAMILKVKERCGEWVENQWVVLLPAGERNNWSSPLLAVNKVLGGVVALGDICLCMDFRRVNKLMKEPTFIIPLLKEMLGRLVGLKIFSELDLVNAYHQVNLDEDSYLLTGFIIPGSGAACWRVLFFGPKGAVTHFQKVVERVVGEVSIDIVIVIYVDNILVGSKDMESHVKELNMVIHALTKAGFKLKPSKCKIAYSMLELDHGLKKPGLGDGGGCSLLTELCGIVRGTGSGVRQATRKFLQEKLDKVRPVTAEERKEILSLTHAKLHMGENMLFNMIWEDGYWWETLWKECKKLTCSCKECMFFNIGRKGFHLVSTIQACWPMDHVIYDFIGKLRVSERGYCFILIMVCVMTCFVFLKLLRTKSAKEVAFALVNVFVNFGVPQILQSDNEQVMVADVLEELRKLGGFQLRRIMKYFPRQNGVVERFVQETKQVLLKWAKGDFSGWEYYIPAIQMGLNDHIISRHRSRPFSVMFGRRMNKFENFEGVELANNLDEGELVKKAQEWGSKLWEILAKEGGEKGDRDCEATNNKKSGSRTHQTLKVGDWVVREVQKRNSKLGERWEGPYKVKGFDEERGGYSLQEMDGRLLKDLSPIKHLKVVEKALDKEQAYEVEKIVGHRGGVNDGSIRSSGRGMMNCLGSGEKCSMR